MFLDQLRGAAPAHRTGMLVAFLEDQILDILQWSAGRRPDLTRGFMEIGLDSLMSVDLQYRLQTELGFAADSPDDFRQPSIEALAVHLLESQLALEPAAH